MEAFDPKSGACALTNDEAMIAGAWDAGIDFTTKDAAMPDARRVRRRWIVAASTNVLRSIDPASSTREPFDDLTCCVR